MKFHDKTVPCNIGEIEDVIVCIIFYFWWKQLNLICTVSVIMDTAILHCGHNYTNNRKVMFPVTNVSDATNESNCFTK